MFSGLIRPIVAWLYASKGRAKDSSSPIPRGRDHHPHLFWHRDQEGRLTSTWISE